MDKLELHRLRTLRRALEFSKVRADQVELRSSASRIVASLDSQTVAHLVPPSTVSESEIDLKRERRVLEFVAQHTAHTGVELPKVLHEVETPEGLLQLRSVVGIMGMHHPGNMQKQAVCEKLAEFLTALHQIPVDEVNKNDLLSERNNRLTADFNATAAWVEQSSGKPFDLPKDFIEDARLLLKPGKVEDTVLIHGDIHPYNLGYRLNGELAGPFDFERVRLAPRSHEMAQFAMQELSKEDPRDKMQLKRFMRPLLDAYAEASGHRIDMAEPLRFVALQALTEMYTSRETARGSDRMDNYDRFATAAYNYRKASDFFAL